MGFIDGYIQQSIAKYKKRIAEMPKKNRDRLIKICDKAINVEDEVFFLISASDSKEDIMLLKKEIISFGKNMSANQ